MTSQPRPGEAGFTLIELLVVILIVAILAAIAIPVFYAQREKGFVAQIQSSLKNAAIAMETYATENNGNYDALDEQTGAALAAYGFGMPTWATTIPGYLTIEANETSYCLQARHNLLTAGSAWRRSTYQSSVGAPQPVPDNCPEL
jgi:type IV pilus assembly protein PilA